MIQLLSMLLLTSIMYTHYGGVTDSDHSMIIIQDHCGSVVAAVSAIANVVALIAFVTL
jgi:hypothetical protein